MRLEQLNKHEEVSYMEDVEANEAILKNTVSKDELCRYLSPLKFLEIETWRKEVPYGDKVETTENEHRKWRTPIQILLPSAGMDDENSSRNADYSTALKDKAGKLKESSAHHVHKRTFEDIQKQNAHFLRRTNSDAENNTRQSEMVRPRIRDISSVGDKAQRQKRVSAPLVNPKRSPEERLRDSYAPVDDITVKKNVENSNYKHNGQIHLNQRLSGSALTRDAVLTSYFAPGRPVTSSRLRNKSRPDSFRNNLVSARPTTQPSPTRSGVTLSSLSTTPPSSGRKISSSSWPGITNDNGENKPRNDRKIDSSDVQVIPFSSYRPHTTYEEVSALYENYQPRHPAFRGSHRSLNRGWRSWTKRSFENRLDSVTQIYQNAVFNKKAPGSPAQMKSGKQRNGGVSSKPLTSETSSGRKNKGRSRDVNNNESEQKGSVRDKINGNEIQNEYVTRISYSLTDGNKITTSRIPHNKKGTDGTKTAKNTKPSSANYPSLTNPLHKTSMETREASTTYENQKQGRNVTAAGNDITTDREAVVTRDKKPSRYSTSPWVSEAFNSSWENEGYYVRKTKPNKTVTFRLNVASQQQRPVKAVTTSQGDGTGPCDVKVDVIKPSTMTTPNHSLTSLNNRPTVKWDSTNMNSERHITLSSVYQNLTPKAVQHWPKTSVTHLGLNNGIHFASAVNSVST